MKLQLASVAIAALAAACAHEPAPAETVQSTPTASGAGRSAGNSSMTTTEVRALEREHYYYNGDTKVAIWCDERVVTEFAASGNGESALIGAQPRAVALTGGEGGVRIWDLSAEADTASLCRDLGSGATAASFSPAFYDAPSTGGTLRSLPGGVVVRFQPDWTVSDIESWATRENVSIQEALIADSNMYLVATPSGFDALETANRIHESGEVVYANPNWWTQVGKR